MPHNNIVGARNITKDDLHCPRFKFKLLTHMHSPIWDALKLLPPPLVEQLHEHHYLIFNTLARSSSAYHLSHLFGLTCCV